MKKALIIGAAGFVGGYLIDNIQENYDWTITVTKLDHETVDKKNIEIKNLDIINYDEVKLLLDETKPDYIFHLAAQSSVALSWKNPNLTVDVNIKGTINVLDAVKELAIRSRILLIGSGEEYGYIDPDMVPISEGTMLRPGNIYAATKACQGIIGEIYCRAYGMDIIMVRAFNHIGPGQAPIFVVSDFCKQVVEIELAGTDSVIKVGNLAAKRDFTDVRDVVRAYTRLVTDGKAGEIYNVGSGEAVDIRSILDIILAQVKVSIEVVVDSERLRPIDVPIIEANVTKIKEQVNWKKTIDIEQTIKETLEWWRNKLI